MLIPEAAAAAAAAEGGGATRIVLAAGRASVSAAGAAHILIEEHDVEGRYVLHVVEERGTAGAACANRERDGVAGHGRPAIQGPTRAARLGWRGEVLVAAVNQSVVVRCRDAEVISDTGG